METVAGTTDTPGSSGRHDERAGEYLLCIAGDRSFTVRFPDSGDLIIGRGPASGLVIDCPLWSRAHAQLLVLPEGLRVVDLGSRHGTLVNGERIAEPRMVGSGDVISVGATLLWARRPVRQSRAGTMLEPGVLVRRLSEELSRAAQYERELAIAVVRSVDRADDRSEEHTSELQSR